MPTRRELLSTLGMVGPAYFLPFLRNKHNKARAQTTPPKRLIVIQTYHGWIRRLWEPSGSETNFQLGPTTAALEPFKSKLLMLSGLDLRRFEDYERMGGSPDGHVAGGMHTLTSAVPGSMNGSEGNAGGPSIDQFVAQEINKDGQQTLLPSIAIAAEGQDINGSAIEYFRNPFYTARDRKLPITSDANTMFRRMFPNGQPDGQPMQPTGPDPATVRRKSVLDFVAKEFSTINRNLPALQKEKLDSHGTAIRALENALELTSQTGASGCVPFEGENQLRSGHHFTSAADWQSEVDIRMRLIQTALACDLTRVVSVLIANPPPAMWGWQSGFAENPHDLAHQASDQTAGAAAQAWAEQERIYHGSLVRLLELLDSVVESDGQTLLDHSAILFSNQLANGNHKMFDHRWILAGSLGGYFRTGRYMLFSNGGRAPDYSSEWGSSGGRSIGDLLTSLANGMGIGIDRFGDPLATNGAINELRA